MIFAYATKHPLSLVSIGTEVGQEISQCIHIAASSYKAKEEEERQDNPKLGKEQK